jgi:hypothetical protein
MIIRKLINSNFELQVSLVGQISNDLNFQFIDYGIHTKKGNEKKMKTKNKKFII